MNRLRPTSKRFARLGTLLLLMLMLMLSAAPAGIRATSAAETAPTPNPSHTLTPRVQRFNAHNVPAPVLGAMEALANVGGQPDADRWRDLTGGRVTEIDAYAMSADVSVYLIRGAELEEPTASAILEIRAIRTSVDDGNGRKHVETLYESKLIDRKGRSAPAPAAPAQMPRPNQGVWSGS